MISPEQPPTWLRYGLDEAFRGCAFGKGVCAFGERGGVMHSGGYLNAGFMHLGVIQLWLYAIRGVCKLLFIV